MPSFHAIMLASWPGAKNRQLAKALFGPIEESGTSRASCVVIWLSADQAATHERFLRRDRTIRVTGGNLLPGPS
jgi:hypothetical protein